MSFVGADGVLVETIIDANGTTTSFVVGRGREYHQADRFECDGATHVPVSAKNNLIKHRAIVLPQGVGTYKSEIELFEAIKAYACRYVNLSAEDLDIAATYVLLSWVYDAYEELPYLRFRGDYGTGKTRALLVIGAIARKAFFASGASTVSPIFHTLDAFGSTLVLDEADFRFTDEKAELVKLLNNGNVKGIPVLRTHVTREREFNPQAFTVFGPKIIAMRGEYADKALESRFLTIEMAPGSAAGTPINLPEAHTSDAEAIRQELLAYRFQKRFEVSPDASLADPALEPRMNQILLPLLSVAPSPTVRTSLLSRAKQLQLRTFEDRSHSLEALLVSLVDLMLNEAAGKAISVGDVAKRFATLHASEFSRPITSRFIGSALRRLGIKTHKSHGLFVIGQRQQKTLVALQKRYGLADASAN